MRLPFPYEKLGSVDGLDTLQDMAKNEDFTRRTVRERVPHQRDTRTVIGLFDIMPAITKGFADPVLFKKYIPFIDQATKALKSKYGYDAAEVKSFMIVKLLPYGRIAEHTDDADQMGIYAGAHRVHVSVTTNKDCMFYLNGEQLHMGEGDIVEIDNIGTHSVVNGGTDRIHIVMDIVGCRFGYNKQTMQFGVPDEFYIKE